MPQYYGLYSLKNWHNFFGKGFWKNGTVDNGDCIGRESVFYKILLKIRENWEYIWCKRNCAIMTSHAENEIVSGLLNLKWKQKKRDFWLKKKWGSGLL